MENHPHLEKLLPEVIEFGGYQKPEKWYDDTLTHGHNIGNNLIIIEKDEKNEKTEKQRKEQIENVSFIDMFASKIDDMFMIYPYETKRDIRLYIKETLIDWVSLHARKFFGPSTSRSISTCLRTKGITLDDLERFAQLVSFFMDGPIKAGNKIVVWYGYTSPSREPLCKLIIKQQGIYVTDM